jgi:predicted nucleic acid-binding protein
MRVKGLIDTEAIIALLDRNDCWHHACLDTFALFSLLVVTSAAVLVELFHLVGDNPHEVDAAWKFLRSGAVSVLLIDDADIPALQLLMKKYQDRPMDFADATLVHLAHRDSLQSILTIDFDDFETYRIDRRKHFRILPSR